MAPTWTWSDPSWRDRVDDDVRAGYREALRRAVDLRDTLAEGGRDSVHRAVFLVDVLNDLRRVMNLDESVSEDLWAVP